MGGRGIGGQAGGLPARTRATGVARARDGSRPPAPGAATAASSGSAVGADRLLRSLSAAGLGLSALAAVAAVCTRLWGGETVQRMALLALAAATALAAMRLRPHLVVALGLLWLMSPISPSSSSILSDAVTALFAVAIAVRVTLERAARPNLPILIAMPLALQLLLLVVFGVLGLLAGHPAYQLARDAWPFVEFALYLVLAAMAITQVRAAIGVMTTLIIGAGVKATYLLIIFVGQLAPTQWQLADLLSHRPLGIVPFLLVPVGCALLLAAPSRSLRIAATALTTLVAAVVLAASFTRTYWVGAPAGVLAGALAAGRRELTRLVLGVAVPALILGAAVVALPGPGSKVESMVAQRASRAWSQLRLPADASGASYNDGSEIGHGCTDCPYAHRRQDEAAAALAAAANAHYLGLGLGAWVPLTFATESPQEARTHVVSYFHTYYIQVALDMGVLGELVFVVLDGACLLCLTGLARGPDPARRGLAAGVLGMWVMEAFQLATLSAPVVDHIPALMAVGLACALAAGPSEPFSRARRT